MNKRRRRRSVLCLVTLHTPAGLVLQPITRHAAQLLRRS